MGSNVVAYGVRVVLKMLIARPRPSVDLVQVIEPTDGYSFPSGHVMYYVVFLGTLTFILLTEMESGLGRRIALGALVLALASIGLSRIYLGVHWLGDVVGGYVFGAVVTAGAIWIWRRWRRGRGAGAPQEKPPPMSRA